jgi:hypothetical protein
MKAKNTLTALTLIFNSYGILVTIIVLYFKILQSESIGPLETSMLISIVVALFSGILADLISTPKN